MNNYFIYEAYQAPLALFLNSSEFTKVNTYVPPMKAKHQFRALQFVMAKPCKDYCSIKVWKQICIRSGLRQKDPKIFLSKSHKF